MRYEAPASLDAATRLLAEAGGSARVLAGGTDLLIQMRADLVEPTVLVDIKNIAEMREIAEQDGRFRLGAAVTGMEIMEHEGFNAAWPGIVDGARLIGSIQIRGRATLGGNLCNASPAADSVPALIAAGALAQVIGPDGRRAVPVEDIATAPGRTSLADGEIVVSFDLPERRPRSGDAYLRFTPRTEMDIAVVGVGVNLALDEAGVCTSARVALGAVAERALLVDEAAAALIGTRVDDEALARAVRGRLGGLPADRRQAGHRRIQDRGRRRSRRTGGPDRAATGGAELMARYHVTTTINGDEVDFLCESDQTLLSVLRDELVMTGTKEGCGTGDCGACSVTVDDRLMCSCLVLGVEIEGKRVETIEGMADGEALHPLQQKFLEHAALQCGICTPGLLVASRALLERNPDPSETEIRYWLAGNLCRCTGYHKIVEAVADAAREMREV